MSKYKILNLYACLGGNRYKWNEVKEDIEVTAVEWDEELARLYQERFPNDTVVVSDAHQYLLDHYKEFDFIWTSPPCPTHSRARFARRETTSAEYPDMMLYQEIIFLQKWFKGDWIVENVIPYYEPLIPAQKRGRHLYWSNFSLPNYLGERICGIMEGKEWVWDHGSLVESHVAEAKARIEESLVRCPDNTASQQMIEAIEKAKAEGDSLGGIISCTIENCPIGLGEPIFGKLQAILGQYILNINAVKGISFGEGFHVANLKGSENNDSWKMSGNKIGTSTNHAGGIIGGMATGETIYMEVAFKPTSTISKEQQTLDANLNESTLTAAGRHDAFPLRIGVTFDGMSLR